MADLVIICSSKREATELAKKTAKHVMSFNHRCSTDFKQKILVRDDTANDTARFITIHEITHGRDRGIEGIRYESCLYEKALDVAIKRKQEENKNDKT